MNNCFLYTYQQYNQTYVMLQMDMLNLLYENTLRQQIQNLITMLFRVLVYAPIVGIGGFIRVLNRSNTSMAWIIGLAILCIIGIMLLLFIIAMPKFKKLQELVDKLNLVLTKEDYENKYIIRAIDKYKS